MRQLKYEKLINTLKSMGKVAVAFSGGVDSAFLLKAAMEALGRENVLSITVKSQVVTDTEMKDIETLAKLLNARHLVLKMDIFSLPQFRSNPIDRCYFCKKHIFKEIIKAASQRGFDVIIDGTNADDEGDFRPGMKALTELKVKSPLKDCGLTKEDIRELSKELGLPTYDKPSLACLASRIPYNEEITEEKLKTLIDEHLAEEENITEYTTEEATRKEQENEYINTDLNLPFAHSLGLLQVFHPA